MSAEQQSSPQTTVELPVAGVNTGGLNSPQLRPWASVVRRGGDSDQIISSPTTPNSGFSTSPPPPEQANNLFIEALTSETQLEVYDVNGDGNAGGQPRRPAWSRPLDGVVEPVSVMGGAVSWPALSESTRGMPRPSYDCPRPLSDGSSLTPLAPVTPQPPQRPLNNNGHANSAANNATSTRPRPRNRNGGYFSGSGPSQNPSNRPSPQVPYGVVPTVPDTPVRGTRPVGGAGGSQSHTSNDHSSHRNNSRRGNYGPRPRGDGTFQNNHGGRRDQDRRHVHHPPQFVPPPPPPMGYMPPPMHPGATPFVAPPRVPVFPAQMGFDFGSPIFYVPTIPPPPYRGMPIIPPHNPPPRPMHSPSAIEIPLPNRIVSQIDYYFSDDNLVKDSFIRSQMDSQGWVPISLIASWPKMVVLTRDIPFILDSLKQSTFVELQGDKVRRRNDWSKWIYSSGGINNSDSGSHNPDNDAAPENVLAASLKGVSLDEESTC